VTPAAAEPVAAAPPPPTTAADPARFDKALAGQVVPPPQPRPEPLRPELARDVKPAVPVADIKPAAVAPAPATPTPATPAPPASATTPTTTPAEVVAKPAPAPAAAPPAATVATTAPAPPVAKPPAAAAPAQATEAPAPAATIGAQEAAAAAAAVAATVAAAAATAAQAATTPPAASPAATVPAATAADDLTRIRAIDVDLMRRLNALGIVRFADLAKLGPVDVARLSQTLGLLGRIEQENWIEQAQILSSGADTYYSRRRQRGEIPPADPVWATRTDGNSDTPPTQSPIATAAAAAAAAAMASGAAATTAAANAATEPAKPAKLADAILSKQAEAEKPRSDLSGLRSVRSEALRPDLTTNENQRSGQPRAASQLDDLKRVRGIGVLIEKKLNSLGITTYEQIANWTNADIDRVSQILDFKGRIERENWVEQARILASGAHTEFSRRVDRGEA
ncbi:MAG: hypothetical protein SH859_11990, partial [Hyphomicrobium aestuarii]|nr:hypothetical protein [Hyphomicrobium aestuarii]